MSEDNEKGPLLEFRRTLYGLGFSLLVIGAAALIFFHVIPTYFRSSERNWRKEKSRTVTLNYLPADDSRDEDYGSLLEELTESRAEIVEELELGRDEVPDRIHVYLHRDLNSLKAAITNRRSSPEVDVPLAIMDVIEGQPIEPVLVRLLTTFTWGRPSSELLRLGLQTYLSDQYEETHLRAAALEGTGFSFEEITSLEETTSYLRSLQDRVYDSFDSPRASAGLDLASLSSLFRFNAQERPYKYELEVQAGSFVSYLIREYGVDKFKGLWRASSLEEGFEQSFRSTVSDIEKRWSDYVTRRAEDRESYRYFRARALFNQGSLRGARKELEKLKGDDITKDDISFLQGRIDFFAGDWSEASKSFGSIAETESFESRSVPVRAFENLLDKYAAGQTDNAGRLHVITPEGMEDASETRQEVLDPWEKAKEKLPSLNWNYSRFSIFLAGEEEINLWEEIEKPDWVAIYNSEGNVKLEVSDTLVRGAKRVPSYSGLLRRGLVHYLAAEEVFLEAATVLEAGEWSPLDGLALDGRGKSNSTREAAAFVGYLIEQMGSREFLEVWAMTTPLGGDSSLDTALKDTVGKRLDEVEDGLKTYLRESGR